MQTALLAKKKTAPTASDTESRSVLAGLRLTATQLDALRKQGFIRREQRGTKIKYRLTFRHDGKRHSRCIPPQDVATLESELAALKRGARARRELVQLAKLARQKLRERRHRIGPELEARGFYLHGQTLRRRRVAARGAPNTQQES